MTHYEFFSGKSQPVNVHAELFKSLKDDAIKVLHSSCQQMSANLEDPAVVTGLEKVNSFPSSQEGWYQRTY